MPGWNLERIEGAFAEAAVEPSLWRQALEVVSAETEAFGAVLFSAPGSVLPSLPHTDSMTACVEEYFRESWHLKDERNRGIPTLLRTGIADDFDAMSAEHMRRHPYYQEYLASHGLKWFVAVRVRAGDSLWILSIQRKMNHQPFSPEEKRRLLKLVQTLPSSVAISQALARTGEAAALDAFETSLTAAVLIDRQGRVIRPNALAERMLTGEVCIRDRRIVATNSSATAALDRALQMMIFDRNAGGLGEPILLPRTGRGPLLAYPGRLPAMMANPLADCQAIVVLVDPDQRGSPQCSNLRSIFKLTEAEARLAVCLASGESIEIAAEELSISPLTARTQLKAIFAKTDTHRQSELVALLSRLRAVQAK
jgi:DNA-binding CsgD family transcriptional regulator